MFAYASPSLYFFLSLITCYFNASFQSTLSRLRATTLGGGKGDYSVATENQALWKGKHQPQVEIQLHPRWDSLERQAEELLRITSRK